MKFGILYNKSNMNIGDDIQAYATERFLPKIDCYIDRENIDSFRTENGEPVAVIMNAWYMWRKWNWPPSDYIYPLMVGFHYADHQLANQWYGSPIKYQFLEGIGGDYLNAFGPVGCRDLFTLNNLKAIGVNAYFSGCITMTIPKMPKRKDKGQYICVVDVVKEAREKFRADFGDKIEIREISHLRQRNETIPWEERKKSVEELLTVYQNARCVITRRLHCALPCLAMGVPVLLVRGSEDNTRFDPYYELLHRITVDEFMNDDFEYDFLNPPENKSDYKQYADNLTKTVTRFVAAAEGDNRSREELRLNSYSERDVINWRHDVMKNALEIWLDDDHKKHEADAQKSKDLRHLQKLSDKRFNRVLELKDKLRDKTDELNKVKSEKSAVEAELARTKSELNKLNNETLLNAFKRKLKKKLKK